MIDGTLDYSLIDLFTKTKINNLEKDIELIKAEALRAFVAYENKEMEQVRMILLQIINYKDGK